MINDKPLYGFAHVGGKLELDHRPSFMAWIKKLAGDTGAEVVIFIADKSWLKTRQQEKGYHAMISPLAREKGWKIDDLKQFFLGEIFGYTTSAVNGKEILVEPHTSHLNKRQYSELIERTMEIAAETFEMWLEAPSDYTERKAKERKQAAKAKAA